MSSRLPVKITKILSETYSVCPVCLARIKARYTEKDGAVFLKKECAGHGKFSCLVARNADDYHNWKTETVNIRPKKVLTQAKNGCPHDCGPCENHLQTACCVLIDVTNRCDQHCAVCFATASPSAKHEPNLTEIEQKLDTLLRMSEDRKFNIQISGGEPAVRDDLPEIIAMAKAKGFEYVQLNTNGKRLGTDDGYAHILKQAGADAVFMQFDSMNDSVYESLRNEKLLEIKKQAVENCRKARLPVALVPTIVRGLNDGDIGNIIRYMLDNVDVIKGVHFQPVSFFGRYPRDFDERQRITMFDTINAIHDQTNGAIARETLVPISTGHELCCFTATFMKQKDGSIQHRRTEQKQSGCCTNVKEPCCKPDIEIISRDRNYVKNKWKMAGTENKDGFDDFLNNLRENSFTITGMAFQDAMTLDTARLCRCRVQVLSDDGMLIPFCAYNLTDTNGRYLYRK